MRNRAPRVSVLLAVHNGQRFLREALDSILDQSYEDFEFLVVNDGSTDRTAEVLASCSDPRLRVLKQERRGLTGSLNHGLELARGEYVARMDADDISEPDRLEEQVRALDAEPDLGLVGCRFLCIGVNGQTLGLPPVPVEDAAIRRTLVLRNPFCHSAVMFRRHLVEEAGGYDEALEYAQDYDLWFRLALRCRMWNHPRLLHQWRRVNTGISVRRLDAQDACARLIRERHLRAWLAERMLTLEQLSELLGASPRDSVILDLLEEVGEKGGDALSGEGRLRYLEARFLGDPSAGTRYLERIALLHLEAGRRRLAYLCLLDVLRREPARMDLWRTVRNLRSAAARPFAASVEERKRTVSVIVPVWRDESDAGERVASVRTEDLPGLEIVLVDATGSAIEMTEASGVERCVVDPGVTLGAALNHGIERARGEFVTFLTYGHRFRPGHLRRLVTMIRSGPYGLASSDLLEVREVDWRDDRKVLERRKVARVRRKKDLLQDCCLDTCNVLFRRDLLPRVGLLDEELRGGVAFDLWLRCAEAAEVVRVPEATCERRVDRSALDTTSGARSFDRWLVRNHHAHLRGQLAALKHLMEEGVDNGAASTYRELKAAWSRGLRSSEAIVELLPVARRFRDEAFRGRLEREHLQIDPRDFLQRRLACRDWRQLIRWMPALIVTVAPRVVERAWNGIRWRLRAKVETPTR